jgi:hypothetical protein
MASLPSMMVAPPQPTTSVVVTRSGAAINSALARRGCSNDAMSIDPPGRGCRVDPPRRSVGALLTIDAPSCQDFSAFS